MNFENDYDMVWHSFARESAVYHKMLPTDACSRGIATELEGVAKVREELWAELRSRGAIPKFLLHWHDTICALKFWEKPSYDILRLLLRRSSKEQATCSLPSQVPASQLSQEPFGTQPPCWFQPSQEPLTMPEE
ncbi:hypothetical protein WJX72_007871 [[Myrmecia] bisecta]|uniref:Uncharacterized protein n=1 Tax=[Myrmecia] bisecta TaxID=41462 RepID=A0AAW1R812_9CHLO